jgi:hypothetical protein
VLPPRQQAKLARGVEDEEHVMSHKLNAAIAVIGIDIGKNSFHVVGLDWRGAIVLRQVVSWPTSGRGHLNSDSPGDANGTSYACFSFLCRVATELTQGSAEQNQFCRRGTKSRLWRKIPTRTM